MWQSFLKKVNLSVVIAVVGASLIVQSVHGYVQNGSTWATYDVCYRIEASALPYWNEIHQAAAAWTSASNNGFQFTYDPDCTSGSWERGFIDGWGGSYGFTFLNGDVPAGGGGPSSPITIESARTIIEDLQQNTAGLMPTKWCRDANDGAPFWDPIGCPALSLTEVCTNRAGAQVLCTACCTNCIFIGNPIDNHIRWDSPLEQAVALHEFGHWLWLGDDFSGEPTAMQFPVPTCKTISLESDDIAGLNFLYP
jgi:hypothetical protein